MLANVISERRQGNGASRVPRLLHNCGYGGGHWSSRSSEGKGSYVRPVERFMPARNADTGQRSVGFSSRARQLSLLRTASKA